MVNSCKKRMCACRPAISEPSGGRTLGRQATACFIRYAGVILDIAMPKELGRAYAATAERGRSAGSVAKSSGDEFYVRLVYKSDKSNAGRRRDRGIASRVPAPSAGRKTPAFNCMLSANVAGNFTYADHFRVQSEWSEASSRYDTSSFVCRERVVRFFVPPRNGS